MQLMQDEYATTSTKSLSEKLGRPIPQLYAKALRMGLRKQFSDENSGRFKKGLTPWNKGVKGSTGCHENSKAHYFSGPPHNTKPLGYRRVNKDGYFEVKTEIGFKLLHYVVWRENFGDVPKNCAIIFIDGDKTNVVIGNLKMLTRKELMEKNTIHRYPADLKEVIRLHCKIKRRLK